MKLTLEATCNIEVCELANRDPQRFEDSRIEMQRRRTVAYLEFQKEDYRHSKIKMSCISLEVTMNINSPISRLLRLIFLPRETMLARYMLWTCIHPSCIHPSTCPSVRLSDEIPMGSTPAGNQNTRGVGKHWHSRQITSRRR